MQIEEINPIETLELRNLILRPDLALKDCLYPGDDDVTSHHFGAFLANKLVGIVSIYRESNPSIEKGQGYRIRSMASSEAVRGRGIGLQLLRRAEKVAFESGADYIWANARVAAIGFYEKADYEIRGNEYNIENIGPHLLILRFSP